MNEAFQQINANLWLRRSDYFLTNSGIFFDGNHAAVIDPGIAPLETEEIRRFTTERNLQVDFIFLTHSHWDHVMDTTVFPGVKIIAQRKFLDETTGEAGEDLRKRIERFFREAEIPAPGRIKLPGADILFDVSLTVTVGDQSLRMMAVPGHCASHAAIYHASSGTLWAGDMLSDIEIPLLSQSAADYERSMQLFASLEVCKIVPGHGHAAVEKAEARRRIDQDRKYVLDLKTRVREAVASRATLEETLAACPYDAVQDREENDGEHQKNIKRVFSELTGRLV